MFEVEEIMWCYVYGFPAGHVKTFLVDFHGVAFGT